MKKSIKFNLILNTIRMALTVIMPLVTFPYTSRIFLADGTGQLNFANSVVTIFTLIASLGIYTYGVREGVKVRNDKLAFSKLAHELLLINFAATIFAYLALFICILLVPSFNSHRTMLLLYSVQILFTAMGCDWIYGVYEEYTYITVRQIAVQLVTIFALFFFVHKKEDIYIWAAISVFSATGANVFNIIRATRYVSFRKLSPYHISKHFRPVLILFATQLAAKVYNNLDTVLLGAMTSDYDTGIYSAAVKVNTILITVFTAMTPVFVPKIMELQKKKSQAEYRCFLKKILSLILGIALPACVGLEMLGKQIILILAGKDFLEASLTMSILAPVILVTSVSNILYYDVLVPIGKENSVLISTVIAAIVNFGVSIILIPTLRSNGAAIGSLIAETVGLLLAIFNSKKAKVLCSDCIPNLLPYLVGSVGIGVCCYVSGCLFAEHLIVNTIVAIVTSATVYASCLLLFHDPLSQETLAVVEKIASKFRREKQ